MTRASLAPPSPQIPTIHCYSATFSCIRVQGGYSKSPRLPLRQAGVFHALIRDSIASMRSYIERCVSCA